MRLSPPFLVPSLASHCPAPAPALRPLGLPGGGLRLWSVRAVKGRRRLGSPLDSHCSAGQGHGPRSPCARWGGGWGGSAWSPLFRPPGAVAGRGAGAAECGATEGRCGSLCSSVSWGSEWCKGHEGRAPCPWGGSFSQSVHFSRPPSHSSCRALTRPLSLCSSIPPSLLSTLPCTRYFFQHNCA